MYRQSQGRMLRKEARNGDRQKKRQRKTSPVFLVSINNRLVLEIGSSLRAGSVLGDAFGRRDPVV